MRRFAGPHGRGHEQRVEGGARGGRFAGERRHQRVLLPLVEWPAARDQDQRLVAAHAFERRQQLAQRVDARLRRHQRAAPRPLRPHLQIARAAVAAQPAGRAWRRHCPAASPRHRRRPASLRARRPPPRCPTAALRAAALRAAPDGGPPGSASSRSEPPPDDPPNGSDIAPAAFTLPHGAQRESGLRFAMSRASVRLPNSHVESLALCPITLAERVAHPIVRPREVTLGPAGSSISADRSTKDRLVKNRDAARATWRTLPGSSVP